MVSAQLSGVAEPLAPDARKLVFGALVCIGYFLGTKLGLALTFQPHPISILWPPNAILLAALLLTPMRLWWLPILAALPAHLFGELQGGVPVEMVSAWFISNCSEAMIGAAGIRLLAPGPFHFQSLRNVSAFIGCGVFLGPLLSSFIDAGFVSLIGWGEGSYWQLWRMRFFSNALAALMLVPVIVTWVRSGFVSASRAPIASIVEAGVFALGLLLVATLLFNTDEVAGASLGLAFAPMPFLIWAALRFGPAGTSLTLLTIGLTAIWGAIHGHGPFAMGVPSESALSIQVFLIVLAIPLLALAAVLAEREKVSRELALERGQFDLALDAARIGTWQWDLAGRKGACSDQSWRILGRDEVNADFTVDALVESVHPLDRHRLRADIQRAIAEGGSYETQFRVHRPDGSLHWLLGKGQVIPAAEGRAPCLLGVVMDITDVKFAEEALRRQAALRESESRFRELADSLPHVIWAARADGFIDYFNRRWYELTGADPKAAGESSWLPFLHADDRERCQSEWNAAILNALPFEMEFRLLGTSPREYRWQLARALPVFDESGIVTRWNGTATDIHEAKLAERVLMEIGEQANRALHAEIAERKRTEGALTHLTRVAVLGEFTGALAHELNQPLTAILANAQATQRILSRVPLDLVEVHETLSDIVAADKRASDVIGHLRALLKKGDSHVQLVHVNEIVREALDIAHADLQHRNVGVVHRLDRTLPRVRGDKVQLEQVILNLLVNACEEMQKCGSDNRRVSIEAKREGTDSIQLSVADSGPGIAPDQLDTVFNPFFTTKEKGLGLGLSISRSIIGAHGGRIWAENVPGGGSVFRIVLPVAQEKFRE